MDLLADQECQISRIVRGWARTFWRRSYAPNFAQFPPLMFAAKPSKRMKNSVTVMRGLQQAYRRVCRFYFPRRAAITLPAPGPRGKPPVSMLAGGGGAKSWRSCRVVEFSAGRRRKSQASSRFKIDICAPVRIFVMSNILPKACAAVCASCKMYFTKLVSYKGKVLQFVAGRRRSNKSKIPLNGKVSSQSGSKVRC